MTRKQSHSGRTPDDTVTRCQRDALETINKLLYLELSTEIYLLIS